MRLPFSLFPSPPPCPKSGGHGTERVWGLRRSQMRNASSSRRSAEKSYSQAQEWLKGKAERRSWRKASQILLLPTEKGRERREGLEEAFATCLRRSFSSSSSVSSGYF